MVGQASITFALGKERKFAPRTSAVSLLELRTERIQPLVRRRQQGLRGMGTPPPPL
jgi:hypothetical protein